MRIAERTSDFEFLTDGEGLLGTDNLEFADSSNSFLTDPSPMINKG